MSQKQLLSIYEYTSYKFPEPLADTAALLLSRKGEELNAYSSSPVFEPLYKNNRLVGIRTFQYVGIIQVSPKLSIQILPKMSNSDDNSEAWQDSIHSLLYMLQYCGKLLDTHAASSQLRSFRGDFYEILIYLFATTLLSEIRNSLYHEYQESEQNLTYLRGKLMFAQHILRNGITQEKFYVSTDNFESDNKLNIIFAYVVRHLLSSTSHMTNRRLLTELNQMLIDIPHKKVTITDAERIHINRMNFRFNPALDLAKLFLSDKSLQLSADSFSTTTYLINMNELFEDYITTVCKKIAPEGHAVYAQGPREYLVSAHYTETSASTQQLFQMKPDISLVDRSTRQVTHIIDTKYKLLDASQKKLGVSQADMYQMYSYSSKYNTRNITLLYPRRPDQEVMEATNIIDNNCIVRVRTIDLNRDLKRSEYNIRQELASILDVNRLSAV